MAPMCSLDTNDAMFSSIGTSIASPRPEPTASLSVGVPQPTRPPSPAAAATPRVTVKPAVATAAPGAPDAATDGQDDEAIPADEDIVTLPAPAAYQGGNDLHLQLVPPYEEDPARASSMALGSVVVTLREDGLLRNPVVVEARIEAPRLATGQVPVLLSGLKAGSYKLAVQALDRGEGALGAGERDLTLDGDTVAPYVARLRPVRGDFAIDEAARPYLQAGSPTTMQIMWTSARDVLPAVRVAEAAGPPVKVPVAERGKRHAFALTGLTPDTSYVWTASEDGRDVASGTFHTNAGPSGRRVRFAAFGDSGRGTRAQFQVARRLAAWKPDFVIVAGDVIYPRGEAKHYGPRFLAPYAPLLNQTVFYAALGNHDYLTKDGQPFLDFFEPPRATPADPERYYTFRWGHLQVWALDSNQDTGPAEAQTRWLARSLAESEATWKVAFFHHPAYSSGAHGSSVPLRDHWEPLFERHDVQLVVSGHDHHYERSKPQEAYVQDGVPTHHVLTGGGGADLRGVDAQPFTAAEAEKHHFVGVTIDDRTLSLEAIDDAGETFDRWRYALPK